MSWFKPYRFGLALSCALLALGGCGFTPMYAQNTAAGTSIADYYQLISVANIPERNGQILRNALIDRLYTRGRPLDARYVLRCSPLKTTQTGIGIRKGADVTYRQMEIETVITLTDTHTGAKRLVKTVRGVSSYDVMDQQYATIVARQRATNLALEDLSANIMTELGLFLRIAAEEGA